MGAEDTGTFRVILRSLVGGHGGSRKESLLYLNYNTSFPLFQIILRDATQLSTIPPIDLDQQTPPKKETSPDIGSEMASQESNIRYSRQSQQRSSESSYRERNSLSPLGPQDIPDQQERAKPAIPTLEATQLMTDLGSITSATKAKPEAEIILR
jgi:hypothetical protein